jgi:hypothetical protein
MLKLAQWPGALLGLLVVFASPAIAVECPAARAMVDGQKDLELRKDQIQRPEWLLMEYLVSDGAKKSRKLFADEVKRSLQRMNDMMKLVDEVKNLPAGTPDIPEDGTPACETYTKVKDGVSQLFDQREAEIKKYLYGDYKFVWGCDQIGEKLVALGESVNKPDSKVSPKSMMLVVSIAMGPQTMAARMQPKELDALAAEVFQPSTLPARTRYAYAAMNCLRNYQGAKIAPLAASTEALARCETAQWEPLGHCVNEATALK